MRKMMLLAGLMSVFFVMTAHGQIGVFKSAINNCENGGAVVSRASANGFSLVYTTVQADCRAITEADVGKVKLVEGDSAVFTFTVASTQISDAALGFGWGFDFGSSVVFCTVGTGDLKYTFQQHRYAGDNGYPFTLGAASQSWKASEKTLPDSSALLKAGNRVTIVTTLKRARGEKYEMTVEWGGQTYNSSFVFAGDHTIDSIFFRSGDPAKQQLFFMVGDNYTVSDVSLVVIPANEAVLIVG